jgi:hypothetical protein
MQDIIVGIISLVVGVMFCFWGYLAMRIIIPIWGGFAGFFFGASLVAGVTQQDFLSSLAGWLVGLAIAVVFFLIAYLYYEVSVILVMTSIGFTLGTTLMVALGVSWSWLVVVVGVVMALALALVAILADLPTGILVVLTSLAGASAIILGIMLIVGRSQTSGFSTRRFNDAIGAQWWWWLIYGGLALAGLISQVRVVGRLQDSMRTTWVDSGGQQIRKT